MGGPDFPVFTFGPFRLDPHEQCLLKDGEAIPLTPKALELLLCLVEHAGRLVRKEELLASVWPDTAVEEAVLSVNVSIIRRALGDDRNGHTYIETVPRAGYRFVAPVSRLELAPDGNPTPTNEPRLHHRVWIAAASVIVLAIIAAVALQIGRAKPGAALAGSSVAVLPLRSLSNDEQQQQFADAMTDLLITDLGRLRSLRVVSLQSVTQYKHSLKSIREIARELKVDYITQGTVARDGGRVRINAQLIRGDTDRHVWAQTYEGELRRTFAIQSEVANSIAREIGVALAGPGMPSHSAQHVPAAAYEAYVRGNYLAESGDNAAAIEQFSKAIALYPDFSEAYARAASASFGLAYFGMEQPKDVYPRMRDWALKAIEKDGSNAEAHAALAEVKLHYDWDWNGADAEFRRSLELNPSDSDVRHLYAHYKLTIGQPAESLAEMDRAFEIDPVGVLTAT